VAVDEESVALTESGLIAVPDGSDWSPGLVTDTVLVMVQLNVTWAAKLSLSVTVMVTG
jgi:hypothetical protein